MTALNRWLAGEHSPEPLRRSPLSEECRADRLETLEWMRREAREEAMGEAMKPRIFCWVNSGAGTDWQHVMAMAEDGTCLAGHLSSSEGFARHDIGITSDWKHEHYRAHYPDGYELVWIDGAEVKAHEGLCAAYEKNQSAKVPTPEQVPA